MDNIEQPIGEEELINYSTAWAYYGLCLIHIYIEWIGNEELNQKYRWLYFVSLAAACYYKWKSRL